ncbi:GDSL-like Lipase/Acylhydrolase superfamily protein [Striga asiatica]|uniref:GDSL-like Lipase/Acylhydrolase superfamily protein n=1 Tax=Striga asiatica TaxID=4170 RepID=A0A5A7QTP2_STRAF|nr:GDSL-like Lipase/Acylhydrolase superfamily protein [Striga asiatica]
MDGPPILLVQMLLTRCLRLAREDSIETDELHSRFELPCFQPLGSRSRKARIEPPIGDGFGSRPGQAQEQFPYFIITDHLFRSDLPLTTTWSRRIIRITQQSRMSTAFQEFLLYARSSPQPSFRERAKERGSRVDKVESTIGRGKKETPLRSNSQKPWTNRLSPSLFRIGANLTQQVQQVEDTYELLALALGEAATADLFRGSVFFVSIGSNDFIHYYLRNVSGVQMRYLPWEFNQLLVNAVRHYRLFFVFVWFYLLCLRLFYSALSWQSFRRQETDGLVGAAKHNESKPKTNQGFYSKPIGEGPKDGACKVDRAPVV